MNILKRIKFNEKKKQNFKKGSNSLSKLSLFQKMMEGFKKCPLSIKNAPVIDYKNIFIKKYVTENRKIISSKITSVSYGNKKINQGD